MNTPGLSFVMPYLFEYSEGLVLFDAGYGTKNATSALENELKTLGYRISDINTFLVSHAHPDHLGMVGWLKKKVPQVNLVMHKREDEWLKDRWFKDNHWEERSNEWLLKHGITQEEIHVDYPVSGNGKNGGLGLDFKLTYNKVKNFFTRENSDGNWRRSFEMDILPDRTLEDGEVIEFGEWRLKAVWTPGHTPGHLCIYDAKNNVMLTGDHVLPRITPNVSLHVEDESTQRSPLAEYTSSLKKVSAFGGILGLPAHEYNIENLANRCDFLIHHHQERLEEILVSIGEGAVTAAEISARVKWNTRSFKEFSIWQKRSALGETLAHLTVLEHEERVSKFEDEFIRWEKK
tara:strand:- start:7772 stop:8812 length:1041 start_codon:yes stop_codon:yes gene_type:complete